ncbi:hypothetical protein LzC2_35840 [Planctomycetes bacterium LzC2]|uniref:Uncharacterized protein n=1 Tax=Alienimonas chondri TaxID=2681879 RepID=A0ABX1VHA3_9PLAN|nr:hypothetical protein [Alienimonas chondri]
MNRIFRDVCTNLYIRPNIPARDRLPYTDTFDEFYRDFLAESRVGVSQNELWRGLCRLQKDGDLRVEKDKSRHHTDPLQGVDELVADLIDRHAPSLASRDRLPYSPVFERIYTDFVVESGQSVSRHQFWRTICNASGQKNP